MSPSPHQACASSSAQRSARRSSARVFWEIYATYFKVGLFTLGGGYAMLPLMEKEIVTCKGWLTQQEFIDMLAVGQSAPGPIAVNGAVFVGHRIRGFWGALVATLGVVMPSFLIVLFLAITLTGFRGNPWVEGAFNGIRPAVVALILAAVYKLGRAIRLTRFTWAIALAAFVGVYVLNIHPIVVLLVAAMIGIALGQTKYRDALPK